MGRDGVAKCITCEPPTRACWRCQQQRPLVEFPVAPPSASHLSEFARCRLGGPKPAKDPMCRTCRSAARTRRRLIQNGVSPVMLRLLDEIKAAQAAYLAKQNRRS